MEIDVVHINPEGDGVTALYVDGALYKYGDYYHDKIDFWVEGFIDGVCQVKRVFQVKYWELPGVSKLSKKVCEVGHSPPELLKKYPKSLTLKMPGS